MLITAIALSSVAAYYSIAGLVAIFAAATIPIIIMGSTLEVAKLVVASWLYRNWNDTPRMLKSYFCMAVVVLMLLTSMGIFGFLSKAHVDQNLVSGDVLAQVSLIDEQIKIERENIDASRKIISQLDQAVDQTIARSTDESGAARGAALRRSQAKDRNQAQAQILSAQAKITKLNEQKAPIAAKVREVEAEVGPIKYIAQLIYGQEATDTSVLEKAVRIVILMIVFVFDPLAVLMFIAVNRDMAKMYHKEIVKPNNDSHVIREDLDVSYKKQAEEEASRKRWERYFSMQPNPDFGDTVMAPEIESSHKPNGSLYHINVEDSVGPADGFEIKADHGMKGLETVRG